MRRENASGDQNDIEIVISELASENSDSDLENEPSAPVASVVKDIEYE